MPYIFPQPGFPSSKTCLPSEDIVECAAQALLFKSTSVLFPKPHIPWHLIHSEEKYRLRERRAFPDRQRKCSSVMQLRQLVRLLHRFRQGRFLLPGRTPSNCILKRVFLAHQADKRLHIVRTCSVWCNLCASRLLVQQHRAMT